MKNFLLFLALTVLFAANVNAKCINLNLKDTEGNTLEISGGQFCTSYQVTINFNGRDYKGIVKEIESADKIIVKYVNKDGVRISATRTAAQLGIEVLCYNKICKGSRALVHANGKESLEIILGVYSNGLIRNYNTESGFIKYSDIETFEQTQGLAYSTDKNGNPALIKIFSEGANSIITYEFFNGLGFSSFNEPIALSKKDLKFSVKCTGDLKLCIYDTVQYNDSGHSVWTVEAIFENDMIAIRYEEAYRFVQRKDLKRMIAEN